MSSEAEVFERPCGIVDIQHKDVGIYAQYRPISEGGFVWGIEREGEILAEGYCEGELDAILNINAAIKAAIAKHEEAPRLGKRAHA